METDPIRVCELLVGLPEITIRGVVDHPGFPLEVHVETIADLVGCQHCGVRAWSKGRRAARLVDLSAFGRPVVLGWHKRRWVCPERACPAGSWTENDSRIAP